MASGDRACRVRKDFLRHIAMPVISEFASRYPAPVIEDAKKWLANAENKFRFSIYGGDPRRVAEFLASEDWSDFVASLRGSKAVDLAVAILERLVKEYSEECPEVAEAAQRALEKLKKSEQEALDPALVASLLQSRLGPAFKVEVEKESGEIRVVNSDAGVQARITIRGSTVKAVVCREASVPVTAVIELIRQASKPV